jgi:hypothetical protein
MNVVSIPYDLKSSFEHNGNVKATEWAIKYCPSYITNDCTGTNNEYYINYYFDDERDMLWFKLMWS